MFAENIKTGSSTLKSTLSLSLSDLTSLLEDKITVFLPGYVEGTEDNLSEALSTCLSVYNEGTSQKIDLVFFSDAVRHAARLSRVLVSQWPWIL